MSSSTTIEWTDATWNPVVGCSRKSPGCIHCYAEMMAARVASAAMAKLRAGKAITTTERAYVDAVRWKDGVAQRAWSGQLVLDESKLNEPRRWRKPRRVFVNSMSDLWHERLPLESIGRVYDVMELAGHHIFQVLTKRPRRRREALSNPNIKLYSYGDVLPNVWEGTSIESADYLDRLDHLRQTPAAVRFLSLEPLLGPLGQLDLTGIHWVIVGGESGPGARPMHPDWVREIRDQCIEQGAAFFFKQWGAWGPTSVNMTTGQPTVRSFDTFQKWTQKGPTWIRPGDVCLDTAGRICRTGADMMRARDEGAFPVATLRRTSKRAAGAVLDGREWREFPEGAR